VLKRAGYTLSFEIVDTPEQFEERIEHAKFDLTLSDHNLRTWTGMDVLERLRKSGKEIPFIVVTGTLGDEAAVEYIKQGAADYVLKHRLERLPAVVGRALREKAHREETARLQEAIFSAKKEWELTFDQVPDAVFLLDEDGRVRRANRAAAAVLGLDFKQMIGQPCYEMIPGLGEPRPDRPPLQAVLDMGEGVRKDIEEPRLGKVFEVASSPLRDSAGGLCGAVVVMRDVTERRRAEESLVKLKKAVDTSGEVIFMTDREGVFTFVNPEFTRLYGYTAEDVVGKTTPRVLKSGGTSQEDYGTFWKAILDKRVVKVEVVNKTKDGRLVEIENSANPILDERGEITGFLSIQLDITERKEAEQHLVQMESRYRGLLEAAPDAMVVVNPGGEIVLLNVQAEKQFGYRRDELVGQMVKNIIPEGFAERLIADGTRSAAEALAQQIGMGIELSGRRKDGSEFPIEIMLSPLESADGILVTAAIRDITERKQLELQLRQSQKMEAIGQLAGGVAHDFNNLLTIISGYGEMVADGLGPDSPHLGQVKEIQKAADRAASLTRQLLAFGRRQVLAPQVLDLNGMVSNMDKMLRRLIGEDINLVPISGGELGRVKADPGQIEQIIMNLAVNARDAMPKGGKLTIETADVFLDDAYARKHVAVTPGPYVMLAVSDTGCGMDAATQARVFEPFFTTKALGKGTGLGLATVYGIVKQSGGSIWIYSELGKGTTFKMYLPRVDDMVTQVKLSHAVADDCRGTETVLVVEDEETIRSLVHGILETRGYTVLEANCGVEGLEICQKYPHTIHLLLTDVVMPQMSGPELAGKLASLRPETKVLFMSGYTNKAIGQDGLLERNTAFIEKPFTPQSLARKVREVLDAPAERSVEAAA
jgi:PAS domain S-box-containing protein